MPRNWKTLVGCLLLVISARAQMPHEVLVLINKNSQPSKHVANVFVATRQIPQRNMVYLDIPENAYGGTATVTPDEFTKLIWEPANAVAKERGLDQQILAWVYSVDFPIRVKTDANDRRQMSVGGLTFMRNKIPGLTLVEEGKYLSKLFGGPNQRVKLNLQGMSLAVHKYGLGAAAKVPPEAAYLQNGLRDRMPLPSMMLGYTGENGTDVQTVVDTLVKGRQSDFRGQRQGIYFIQTDDVRSKCREYQFYPAVNEMSSRGIMGHVVTNFPAGAEKVMGVMMGAENVVPSQIKSFAPGAMAEHLTSWSAEFQRPQTKCTDWLKAGATGTAGAVVEPYSNPNKFPTARFFSHYVAGCSMMESFYQSIACPLQTLLLGDPMARPYALPVSLNLLGAARLSKEFTYVAQAKCREPAAKFLYSFYIDGKEVRGVSDDPTVYVRTNQLADGYHELRAVARINHLVQFYTTFIKPFTVDLRGRSLSIVPEITKLGTYTHGLKVKIEGTENPEKVRLVCGEQILDEKDYGFDVELVLDEQLLGEGPNRIRMVGIYKDGMEVSSSPMSLGIEFSVEQASSPK